MKTATLLYQGSALPLSYGSDRAAYAHEISEYQAVREDGAKWLTRHILALGSGTLHEPARKPRQNPGSPVQQLFVENAHD